MVWVYRKKQMTEFVGKVAMVKGVVSGGVVTWSQWSEQFSVLK